LSTIARLKEFKRTLIDRHVRPDNLKALSQVLTTLLPLAALWYGAALSAHVSYWLTAVIVAVMSLFLLRGFVLMHECGHGSLFRTARLNQVCGFLFGVVSGMPQYVWSRHHQHHHSTNGNWDKYRGPLNVIPVEEYVSMSARQQRRFRNARNIRLVPFAGFLYLIFHPRMTLLRGSVSLVRHLIKSKTAQPGISIKTHALSFKTPHWSSAREYWHMFWNSVVLMSLWVLAAWIVGPLLFIVCYSVSVSLAGGAGILLFTVQHNFEHSYASENEGWDRNTAAFTGTSFLVLPCWLNWFTANIAYHHIHHFSSRIPNYCLRKCHDENLDLFAGVTRIRFSGIPRAFRCILWDTLSRRIVSVAEYQQPKAASGEKAVNIAM
jgi:omega-6 fatty acid desaturase (delta-12 desaturase)